MWHMKDNGQGYLFCKKFLLIKVHVKAVEAVEAGQKNRRFSNTFELFSFLAKLNFLKDFFTKTLHLLDLIGF